MVSTSEFKYEDPGFDPLAGQGKRQVFFLSLRVNSCAELFVPDPPSIVYMARTRICEHVKDSISICLKRVGPTAYGNSKILHTLGLSLIKFG